MAVTITPHLVRGHHYHEDDKTGTLTEYWRVDGLPSDAGITDAAIRASDAGTMIPAAGQQHPKLPDMVMRGIDVQPVTRTSAYLTLTYIKVRRRLLDVRLNGVSIQGTTQRDRNGKIIVVGYQSAQTGGRTGSTDPGTPFPDMVKDNGWDYNYGPKIPCPIGNSILEIVYLEKGSPQSKIDKYSQCLNSKSFQNCPAREWYCDGIMGQIESPIPLNLADLPDQQVVTGPAIFMFIVTYRFIRRKRPSSASAGSLTTDSWDPLVVFVNPSTQRTPNDVDPKGGGWPEKSKGNGWVVPEVLGEADFNELNLVDCFREIK